MMTNTNDMYIQEEYVTLLKKVSLYSYVIVIWNSFWLSLLMSESITAKNV